MTFMICTAERRSDHTEILPVCAIICACGSDDILAIAYGTEAFPATDCIDGPLGRLDAVHQPAIEEVGAVAFCAACWARRFAAEIAA